jgi:fatty acid-binding protein DegV
MNRSRPRRDQCRGILSKISTGYRSPTTTQPSPVTYANAYRKLAKETDEILVVTLSSKLSGHINRQSMPEICWMEIAASKL